MQLTDIRKDVQCPICLGMVRFEHCVIKFFFFNNINAGVCFQITLDTIYKAGHLCLKKGLYMEIQKL